MSKKNRKNYAAQSAKKAAPAAVKTVETEQKRCMVEYIAVNILCLFLFLAFGYIAIMSFFQTSVIDPNNYVSEVILYQNDILILNLLLTALLVFVLFKLRRFSNAFAKINLLYLEIGLVVYTTILGLFWIYSVTSVPAADSQNIFETATKAAQGDYTPFVNGAQFYNKDFYNGYSYFNFYPFQLGFVFICELVYRIFGTGSSMPIQVLNVLSLSAAYFGLARITRLLFKRKSVEFFAILMLAACFQPILLCSFAYGNIIGMSCAILASWFLIKYFQTCRWVWIIPSGCLLVLATLAKYNNMIYLVAFVIMLAIHAVKMIVLEKNVKKLIQSLAFALAMILVTVGANNLVIMVYEARAGVELESGMSQLAYLDMGLTDSYMAPGWYTRTGLNLYLNNNLDGDRAKEQALTEIGSKLGGMAEDPEYTLDFFSKKILSQWNEPTFESVWVSKVKTHSEELGWLGDAVYNKSLGQFLELHFNFFVQVLYLLFAIGIYFLFIKKKSNIETVLLPLVVLGGFGYHLLFEGKSQYILTYIPLLIPVAAFALSTILFGRYERFKKLIGKIGAIPNREKNKK